MRIAIGICDAGGRGAVSDVEHAHHSEIRRVGVVEELADLVLRQPQMEELQ